MSPIPRLRIPLLDDLTIEVDPGALVRRMTPGAALDLAEAVTRTAIRQRYEARLPSPVPSAKPGRSARRPAPKAAA